MGLFDNLTKKQLQRKNLVNIIENWDKKKETNIDKDACLTYLNKLEEEINKHSYKKDNRYITYGRREILRKEFTERLNDTKQTNDINKYLDALADLEEYIYTQNHIWIGAILDNVKIDFKKLDKINTEYYKSGIICKEEKDIIIDMINEFKEKLSINDHLENIYNDKNIEMITNLNKQYNVNLNYTIESMNELMSIIDSAKSSFERKEIDSVFVDNLITILGTYVGDTLLKNGFANNGFKWTVLEEIDNDKLMSFLNLENMKGPFVACIKGLLIPIDKVRKYWNNGKEDDLYSYCKAAIQYLKIEFNNNEDSHKFKILF